jgi:hypothetical protein
MIFAQHEEKVLNAFYCLRVFEWSFSLQLIDVWFIVKKYLGDSIPKKILQCKNEVREEGCGSAHFISTIATKH